MMARYAGGRPGSSRRVRLVPVRRSGMDHRAVARIVLAMARQMAAEADEAVESAAVDEVVSSGAEVCAKSERVASVGRCAANEAVSASAGSGLAGWCARQRHDGARYLAHGTPSATSHAVTDRAGAAESDEAAAPSSSTASHAVPDRAGTAESGEDAAPTSTPGGTP